MIKKIQNILKSFTEVSDWLLFESNRTQHELYLIKNDTESVRTVNSTSYTLSVFVNKDDKTGTATRTFNKCIEDAELAKQISETVFAASLALNTKYDLPALKTNDTEYLSYDPTIKENPLKALNLMKEMIVSTTNDEKEVELASSEIFVSLSKVRQLNSKGLDYSYFNSQITLEIVLLAGENDNQVESHLIRTERFISNFDLKHLIQRYSEYARNNLSAKIPESGKYSVIFTEEALSTYFDYYTSQASASSIYNKMSKFKLNEEVITESKGDKLTLSSDPSLPGGLNTEKYDYQGLLLEPFTFIENNEFTTIAGNQRYCQYLGTAPYGFVSNLIVKPGKLSFEELLEDNTLILARFSEFTPNTVTGGFSGEIRNGLLYKNGQFTPVKGGSVTGMMDTAMKEFYLSSEQVQTGSYNGPKYIKVCNLDIAGK